MNKVAISGMGGMIGSRLATKFVEKKYKVLRIPQELLYNPAALKKFFDAEQPEYIVNLAAYGNHSNQDDGAMTVMSNIIGAYNMMSASLDVDYKGFLQVGSSSEYGKKEFPMRETDLPEGDTFYAASKVGATYLARAFAKQYQKPIFIARPFSIYGEGEADFRFIPTIIRSMIKKEKMKLEETAVHDWVYLDDCIEAMFYILEKAKPGEIVNIGTGRETTNLQIVQILQNISNMKLDYEKIFNTRPQDSQKWSADASKLLKWGFNRKFPLGLGLAKTFEYYKVMYGKTSKTNT